MACFVNYSQILVIPLCSLTDFMVVASMKISYLSSPIYVYNYVCMYVCMYVCVYVCVCACVRACMRARVRACVGVGVCAGVRANGFQTT